MERKQRRVNKTQSPLHSKTEWDKSEERARSDMHSCVKFHQQ